MSKSKPNPTVKEPKLVQLSSELVKVKQKLQFQNRLADETRAALQNAEDEIASLTAQHTDLQRAISEEALLIKPE